MKFWSASTQKMLRTVVCVTLYFAHCLARMDCSFFNSTNMHCNSTIEHVDFPSNFPDFERVRGANIERIGSLSRQYKKISRGVDYAIIMPIFNAGTNAREPLKQLFQLTSGSWELLILFDACTDDGKSLVEAQNIIFQYFGNSSCSRVTFFSSDTPLFESAAENVLMFSSKTNPRLAHILVQQDMVIFQEGWNRILYHPIKSHSNILALSARCGHGFKLNYMVGKCGKDFHSPPKDLVKRQYEVVQTDTVNRGPLLLNAKRKRELWYFDSFNFPFDGSDHDLMARSKQFNATCAVVLHLNIYSPREYSASSGEHASKSQRDYLSGLLKKRRSNFRQYIESAPTFPSKLLQKF